MRIQRTTNQPVLNNFRNSRIATENNDSVTDTKNHHHIHINSSAITIITLASVTTILMLSRNFQKNANKYLNKLKDYLGEKLEKSSLNDSNKKTKLYEFLINRVNSFIKKTESINNITSAKDILFMKLMYKYKPTKELHKSISDFFEKISRQTVFNSYKQTAKNFEIMNKTFDKLDEYIIKNFGNEIIEYKGEKHTKKELIEVAKGHRDTANIMINTFMSKETLDGRYKYINEVTASLYSKFWDSSFKDFWSSDNKFKRKEMWQTFIAAEQIKGDKTKLAEWIAIARDALTYNNADRSEQIYSYIKNFKEILPENDKIGLELIEKLEWYTKHPEALKDNKEVFYKELSKLEEHKIPKIGNSIAKTQEQIKQSYINIIKDLADDNKTGELQDMLSIYYKISPYDLEKSGALLSIKKAVASFDKSVEDECVEFFDKIRDLRLGSAPTDILTIIFSFMALTLGLGYAKDSDSRKSIMLTSGIPLIGGIAATTYSTTKLVSGGKSLAFGFLSAIVLNQLGKIADNIRKNKSKDIQ